jgi:hypothetical protein
VKLPGGKGSGKTESDGLIRKNQSTGLVISFLFLFPWKTETDIVLEMCFLKPEMMTSVQNITVCYFQSPVKQGRTSVLIA